MDVTWEEHQECPYTHDLSDVDWSKVTHVRLGYDEDDWEGVRTKGLDPRGAVKLGRNRFSYPTLWPEDIWGIRYRE